MQETESHSLIITNSNAEDDRFYFFLQFLSSKPTATFLSYVLIFDVYRNLTVKITGMERDVQPNSKIHKISSLKLSDNIIPFKLKSDGVIGML